jgi:transcriptional regulator with XRE-family HTH domain
MSRDFGIWMKERRLKKSMSQERLGKMVGVHGNTILRWETGTQFPPLDMAERIIEVLGGVLLVGEINNGRTNAHI